MRVLIADFETTVYSGQTHTEVWAAACVEMFTEDVYIFNCIEDFFSHIFKLNEDLIVYFHNLKFDGEFILYYLLNNDSFTHAFGFFDGEQRFKEYDEFENGDFKYIINDVGQWYTITLKWNNKKIEIRDSLKLLPFSVKQIGESFQTTHKKLSIEYVGERHAHGVITNEEKSYIANDVLVVKEALQIMYKDGHNKLTIGSCCLKDFMKTIGGLRNYNMAYPDLTKIEMNEEIYGAKNVDEYIRRSYKGGWCYVKSGENNKIINNGITLDVNSLYPFVMHSKSKCRYPSDMPFFFVGDMPDNVKTNDNIYYFVTVRCSFKIKKGKLPFIQKKGSLLYKGNECLVTSDYYDKKTQRYYRYIIDDKGVKHDTKMTITFTKTDYILFKEHYNVFDEEVLHGVYFFCLEDGIFDNYIDKYMEIKMNSKGAKRTEAKLFLNNLYGKLASGTNSSYKVAHMDNEVHYEIIDDNKKKAGYIAVGSAITSYARNWTIRHAQMNYDNFIYADTDSMHLKCGIDEVIGCVIDDKELGAWKCESFWSDAIFVRQKTYIEYVTHENCKEVTPHYEVKCAGMPDRCKGLLINSFTQDYDKSILNDKEIEFCSKKRTLLDFKQGLRIPSKLVSKRYVGGVVLWETTYELR